MYHINIKHSTYMYVFKVSLLLWSQSTNIPKKHIKDPPWEPCKGKHGYEYCTLCKEQVSLGPDQKNRSIASFKNIFSSGSRLWIPKEGTIILVSFHILMYGAKTIIDWTNMSYIGPFDLLNKYSIGIPGTNWEFPAWHQWHKWWAKKYLL